MNLILTNLRVVDCFDVPVTEKAAIQSAVNFGAKNDRNIVFLNNVTNIKYIRRKMNQTLETIIDGYKNNLIETPNLQISKENFSDETICDEMLYYSSFKNLSLLNCNFTNTNCDSSFFEGCLFKNCTFKSTSFHEAEFENCILTNCRFINCNLSQANFTETNFCQLPI